MSKWGVIFLLIVVLINLASAFSVRINEVELNPSGTDSKNEWIELYSSQEISLDGWTIVNAKGKVFGLNGSFSEYKAIITPYNFLTNDKQKIKLFDSENNLVDETDEISDSYNDERSWQVCDGEWKFELASKDEKNECSVEEETIEESDKVYAEKDNVKENSVIESSAVGDIVDEQIDEQIDETETITLNLSKGIKTWKSKKQYIKEYALIGFALFCLLILVYLIRKNGKDKNDNDF